MTVTPAAVRRRQSAVFASMSGAERVACAVEMAEEAKAVAIAGIRTRRPALTDTEVSVVWLRLLHGDVVAIISTQDLDTAYLRRWAEELEVTGSLYEAMTAAKDGQGDSP